MFLYNLLQIAVNWLIVLSLWVHPDCNNYRGITLLSCLGKIFTSTLNERLYTFCENNHILKEIQAAFRKGHRSATGINPGSSIIHYLHE